MNIPKDSPTNEQLEHNEVSDNAPTALNAKKTFVEPTVSVPVDVLEATALFQSPTVEATAVNS